MSDDEKQENVVVEEEHEDGKAKMMKPKKNRTKKTVRLEKGTKVVYEKKKRAPRPLTEYQKWIKSNYDSVRNLPNKERMGALAVKWKALKK